MSEDREGDEGPITQLGLRARREGGTPGERDWAVIVLVEGVHRSRSRVCTVKRGGGRKRRK